MTGLIIEHNTRRRDGVAGWGILPRRDFLVRSDRSVSIVRDQQQKVFGAVNAETNVDFECNNAALARGVRFRQIDDAACCRCNLLRLIEGHKA
ncbi:hypothetical protein NZK35_17880 [Stieleria sp. ICT_E10.1]|uniref:hypothetical protein n=1 Tax=Stieleria sedimenti TaxID=2976331 RepID=UPI00217F8D36|nr:hypothetical protein [Stieleria sedimenti]MCS7468526.1 hypothetical protein [Stieleria sedimenti]